MTVTAPSVRNLVLQCDLQRQFTFENMVINRDFYYNPEQFPAAVIRKWRPAHVTLFCNGKAMITGIKSFSEAHFLICALESFLSCHKELVVSKFQPFPNPWEKNIRQQ